MKAFTNILVNSSLPRSFREIHLELAREKGHPEGDRATGYTLIVPLDDDGRIDAEVWKTHREACRVIRIRPLSEDTRGNVVRRPGGTWAFRYSNDPADTPAIGDEVGYNFAKERFVPGEYVSVREDNREHTYVVKAVRPLA